MNEKWFEIIDDYLNGRMSREEQLRFEAELKANEVLSSVFNVYRTIEEDMRSEATSSREEVSLRNSLETLNKKYFGTDSQRPGSQERHRVVVSMPVENMPAINPDGISATREEKTRAIKTQTWKKLAVAAVVISVVAVGTIWFLQSGKEGSEQVGINIKKGDTQKNSIIPDTPSEVHTLPRDIAQSNENATPQPLDKRNGTVQSEHQRLSRKQLVALYTLYAKPDTLPGPGERALALQEEDEDYENRRYKEAISNYNNIIARISSPEISTRGQEDEQIQQILFYAYYYKGQSYIAMDSAMKAIPALNKAVKNSPDNYWKGKAEWYLALTYLRTGQLHKTEALLKQLVNNKQGGDYKQQAKELISKLAN